MSGAGLLKGQGRGTCQAEIAMATIDVLKSRVYIIPAMMTIGCAHHEHHNYEEPQNQDTDDRNTYDWLIRTKYNLLHNT